MSCGKDVKPGDQVALRDLPERELHRRAKVRTAVLRHPDLLFANDQDRAARIMLDAETCRLATQEDDRPGMPFGRRVLRRDSTPLSLCPGSMRCDERLRLALRAAARDGDPQRTIRLDADDVLARPALAHELNDGPFAGGNSRRRLIDGLRLRDEKREIQLQANSGYTFARAAVVSKKAPREGKKNPSTRRPVTPSKFRGEVMKTLASSVIILGMAVAVGVAAQQSSPDDWCSQERSNSDRETVCEVRQFTVPATAGVLGVTGTNGGISVEGQSRGDVHVLAKVTAQADTQARAREIASAVRVNASLDRVDSDGPRNLRDEGWSVSYRLAVPRALNLSLQTTNGGIRIEDIESKVEFRTTNGGVKLARVDGDVRGGTTNGGVDIELEGPAWQGEGLDVQTTNGGVRLAVPEHYSATLEASTNNGGLNIDVPGAATNRRSRHVAVQLGSGGAPIRVRTSNGGVSVRRK